MLFRDISKLIPKGMAADFNAIVREAGWFAVLPLRPVHGVQKVGLSAMLDAVTMNDR